MSPVVFVADEESVASVCSSELYDAAPSNEHEMPNAVNESELLPEMEFVVPALCASCLAEAILPDAVTERFFT